MDKWTEVEKDKIEEAILELYGTWNNLLL